MRFAEYQKAIIEAAEPSDTEHEIIPMLGIGGHVGALLAAQQRYLRDALLAGASISLVGRELGEVIRWCALLAHVIDRSLDAIAHANLVKVDARAKRIGMKGVELAIDQDYHQMDVFQDLCAQTDQEIDDGIDPLSISVPMLGLAGEAGSLLVEIKKKFRGDPDNENWQEFVVEEIGDILWYVSAVARHSGLRLGDIAVADIARAQQSSAALARSVMAEDVPILDRDFPPTEQFPRQLVFRFQERIENSRAVVTVTLIDVEPNAFPDGPIYRDDVKFQGFTVPSQLGDRVNDNSFVNDSYRYHDAVHLGFLTVLGWSPNLRGLMHLKRKSSPTVDENEDGARAVFAEEGLAAIFAKRADDSQQFANPKLVSEDLVDLATTVVEHLEVSSRSTWLWREAISAGFTTMRRLSEGRGGYVHADLDLRCLSYSKLPPQINRGPRATT